MTTYIDQHKIARITGLSLIVMAVAAGFSYGYVLEGLVVKDDPIATFHNIATAKRLFNFGVYSWVLIVFLDVLVAKGFFELYRSTNKNLSMATACLRIGYVCLLVFAIWNLIVVQMEINGTEHSITVDILQAQRTIMLINSFYGMWSAGLIVFGVHLLLLALLILQSKSAPKILIYLLFTAAISYLLIHSCYLIAPKYNDQIAKAEMFLSLPMAVGELALAVWLLWKGRKARLNIFNTRMS